MEQIRSPEIKFTQFLVNIEFVNAISGKIFNLNTINPTNGEVIIDVQEGDKED
jgi:hypothetical protein